MAPKGNLLGPVCSPPFPMQAQAGPELAWHCCFRSCRRCCQDPKLHETAQLETHQFVLHADPDGLSMAKARR